MPIPSFLLSEIVMLKQRCSDDDFFLTGSPRPTEPRTYTLRFKSFLKRIGVPYRNFHSLRHTFATQCIKSGVDVKTLSELLGHSSVKITLDRYIRRFREAYLVLMYYTNPAAVMLYVNSDWWQSQHLN